MTAAVLDTDTNPTRQAWRSLLWLAPLTALWTLLNYWHPEIQSSGVPNTAIRASIHVLTALGLWWGLERVELSGRQRRNIWLAVMIPYTLWLAAIWNMAIYGVFKPGHFPRLLPLAIFLPVIVGTPLLLRSKRIGQVLDALPATWLVALQVYRVFGAIFLVGWARGVVPGIFALPAGTGDVITGLLALPAAAALAAGNDRGRGTAIAWNIFGLLDFTIAVGIGLMIAPGPLQVIVPSIPNPGAGAYPTVLIPAFAVPSSILLHALSLRQLRRAARLAGSVAQRPGPAPLTA